MSGFSDGLAEIILQLLVYQYGEEGLCLKIPNYLDKFAEMKLPAAMWVDVDEDDTLFIYVEPLETAKLINMDDITNMERQVRDGKFN